MPDLTDDLRSMLHDRAEDAPATPPPPQRLVRRVRRRRATRVATAVGGSTLALVSVVGIAAGVVRPEQRSIEPSGPRDVWSFLKDDDRYEFCDPPPAGNPDIIVTVHETELKFARGCYTARATTEMIQFSNGQQQVEHDLQIRSESGKVVPPYFPPAANISYADRITIAAGDYELVCTLHPTMRGQLVIR
jgi:plastocyanin